MITCVACSGTGDEKVIIGPDEMFQPCSACDGEGQVEDPDEDPTPFDDGRDWTLPEGQRYVEL